jgi:DNA-binding GntR family transcriptional regulator
MCPNLLDYDLNHDSLYRILQEEYHIHLTDCHAMIEAGSPVKNKPPLEVPIPSRC